jgi:nitrite reductase (NAD(P)H)
MVKKATAEALGRNQATAIEIVEPSGALEEPHREESGDGCGTTGACGGSKLEW